MTAVLSGAETGLHQDLTTIRVMVVDDQEHVRRWERKILRRMGIADVTECEDGETALARVSAPGELFDVILLDLRMPHLDGIEFIRAISILRIQTAVILVSMEPERVVDTATLLAEEQDVHLLGIIAKPVSVEKLEPLLARLRAGRSEVRPVSGIAAQTLGGELANGTLHLAYQPKIAMATGRLVGVEALARWRHPSLGVVMPDVFVAVCEASPSLGAWLLDFVLREALSFAQRMADSGTPLPVSVNVHASAFADMELPKRVEDLADSFGVPHERLTLELTERAVGEHAVTLLDVATRLRLKHFGLAIDRFGTGHLSLSQLQRLPFSELKIDRSFISGAADSSTKRSVVEASVSLARNLQMTSVAEGIQQRPEWDLLESLGCEQMQGYFIARPMSEEGLQAWTAQWNLNSFAPTLARR